MTPDEKKLAMAPLGIMFGIIVGKAVGIMLATLIVVGTLRIAGVAI